MRNQTLETVYGVRASAALTIGCLVLAIATASSAQTNLTILHSFGSLPHGGNPSAGVIHDDAGNLYGTAPYGGSGGGVVFKVDPAGHQTVLYSFSGGADGGGPVSDLSRDPEGNLYGTTAAGGQTGNGVVFKVDKSGHETRLYSFTGGADGQLPLAGVVRDSSGNLYGAAAGEGSGYSGTIYKLDPANNFSVLHSFTGADGAFPNAVNLDSAGNLYGTTALGGSTGNGVVFRMDPSGNETVLYNFTGGADGGSPRSGVVLDSAGNLYGAAQHGGSGTGVVFKLDTSGNETPLYTFTGGPDGAYPNGVIRDSAGNLYGTTSIGGTSNAGVVFKVDPSGNETVLYAFTGGADGSLPSNFSFSGADVVRGSGGVLYGTTYSGGPGKEGVVFKVPVAGGSETVVYGFPGSPEGAFLWGGVIRDSDGNLYGTTTREGPGGAGTVFKLDRTGHLTTLHGFTGGTDGGSPQSGVFRDPAGNLYGTTPGGGSATGSGVVYMVDPRGNETVLYTFTGGADGGSPFGSVIRDPAGNLYGTSNLGGSANKGVVYKLDPNGNEFVLHNFTGGTDGSNPLASLIRDAAGNLWGTASGGGANGQGDIFKLDSSGKFRVLYSFTGGTDGGVPYAGVTLDSTGNLYGTTSSCTGTCYGAVYKLDTLNNLHVLHTFTGGSDGGRPFGGVVLDTSFNVYGTTTYPFGNVYTVDTAGNLTVLYTGGYPYAGVIRDAAGNLYGTGFGGSGTGKFSSGDVFMLH